MDFASEHATLGEGASLSASTFRLSGTIETELDATADVTDDPALQRR
jgi:hypothetical protein